MIFKGYIDPNLIKNICFIFQQSFETIDVFLQKPNTERLTMQVGPCLRLLYLEGIRNSKSSTLKVGPCFRLLDLEGIRNSKSSTLMRLPQRHLWFAWLSVHQSVRPFRSSTPSGTAQQFSRVSNLPRHRS